MRSGGSRLAAPALAIVAFVVLLGATGPQPPILVPNVDFVATPGGAGGEGLLSGDLGLLLLAALALAVIVAGIAAAVILYRTRGSRVTRAPEEGWWTCQSCGAGNIDGAARCHACATWRTSAPRPTTTT
jgi:hypothetical protein